MDRVDVTESIALFMLCNCFPFAMFASSALLNNIKSIAPVIRLLNDIIK